MGRIRQLSMTLSRAGVKKYVRRSEFFERPSERKRRLGTERHRRRFQEMVSAIYQSWRPGQDALYVETGTAVQARVGTGGSTEDLSQCYISQSHRIPTISFARTGADNLQVREKVQTVQMIRNRD